MCYPCLRIPVTYVSGLYKGERGGFSFLFSSLYPRPAAFGRFYFFFNSESLALATRAWLVCGYFLTICW